MALMRFFTPEWWCGMQSSGVDKTPEQHYRQHLARLLPKMPADLRLLATAVSLQNGHLRSVDVLLTEAAVRLAVLTGEKSPNPREFVLHYAGVWTFRAVGDPESGLPGPYGFGDWGYDEIDLSPGGEWEHRILFSSGIELQLRFASFRLGARPELPERLS